MSEEAVIEWRVAPQNVDEYTTAEDRAWTEYVTYPAATAAEYAERLTREQSEPGGFEFRVKPEDV